MSDDAQSGSLDGDDVAAAALARAAALHAPVLIEEVLTAAATPVSLGGAVVLDGTFGAGGYARRFLEHGAARVIGLDRDPEAIARGAAWSALYGGRLDLIETPFSRLDVAAAEAGAARLDVVALDLGVSSMQLDVAERGFSFMRDGPLDMRMGDDAALSAEELIATADEATLADVFFHYGEERAARRVARRIVAARAEAAITTTARLADIVAAAVPKSARGRDAIHPATRAFQGLRIAVNRELDELVEGLAAAERALAPGGVLAVVSFHSLEDRIVKRFFSERARPGRGQGSRHAPPIAAGEGNLNQITPSFVAKSLKPVEPSTAETASNPRARSAKLRAATRTDAPAVAPDPDALGAPRIGARTGRTPRRR